MRQIKLIGVCLSTIHEEDRFNFVNKLNKYAVESGYRLLVFNSCADLYEQGSANNEGSSAVFKLIPYDKLSALIIFPNIMYSTAMADEVVKNCRAYNIPVISMDKEIEGCITFSFTNADIFEKLCCHVIEDHGARNIYMIAGFKDNIYSEERIEAFKKALKKNNIPYEPKNVDYGCFWELPTLDVLNKWFKEEKRPVPDAIICANDFMAITATSYLQEMGVRIPEDCIITGFDGIKQTKYLPPNITTCKQDFDKMGKLITETIVKLEKGEKVKGSFYVNFNIIYSQSCGCMKINYDNVSSSIRTLIASLRNSDERQKIICNTQASIPKITDINYLPRILMNRFRFSTCIFALNDNIFSAPDFGQNYKGENCFSDNVNILYHRYDMTEYEQCRIPRGNLIPRYDLIIEKTDPIIICSSNFTDMVTGYCVFQPSIDIDEYKKMHSLMATIGAALGNLLSRVQIKSINLELQKLSQRDFMTGLFNRRGFFDKLDNILANAENSGSTLIIISADLDKLKYINDTFGHAEGDNAITTVGRALLSSSRQNEICARFGGDEFCAAMIIHKKNPEIFFKDFKERFFDYLSDYNKKSGKPYSISASIGFHSDIINKDINIDDVIKAADKKMYQYKIAHKQKK